MITYKKNRVGEEEEEEEIKINQHLTQISVLHL